MQGARRAPRRAGRHRLSAQRRLPGQPPALGRPARLPGLEGGDEADRPGRRRRSRSARAWARSARCRSTASTTGRRKPRSSRSRPTTPTSAWSRRSPSASAATPRPRPQALPKRLEGKTLACDATKAERAKKIAAEKAAWEKELDELDARAGPVQPRHDRGAEEGARQLAASAPGAARAREGDAAARHGLDRHRQHQLGRQQLPALRGAALVLRADELRQLRLRAADHHRRQVRGAWTGRRSPTPATAPGA